MLKRRGEASAAFSPLKQNLPLVAWTCMHFLAVWELPLSGLALFEDKTAVCIAVWLRASIHVVRLSL